MGHVGREPSPEASVAGPEARPDQQSDPSAAPHGVQAELLTDERIEALLKASGGRWTGSVWEIEDADLHPFVRTAFAAAAPAQAPQRLERRMPDGLIDSLIASETPGFGLPSPAPAVQPTSEVVAELVEALTEFLGAEGAPFPPVSAGPMALAARGARLANARNLARLLLAKHGQPQGGSDA